MDKDLEVHVCRSFRHPGQYIQMFIDSYRGGEVYAAKPLEFELRTMFEVDSEPTLSMNQDMAQKLIDSLWDCGLRPSEGSGSAGAMLAVQEHLKDMKKIAFNRLKITD